MDSEDKQKIYDAAPDRDNREAMFHINKLNDKFANARFHLRPEGTSYDTREHILSNPCIDIQPLVNDVWKYVAVCWGGKVIAHHYGIPTWSTAIEYVEKHLNQKIRYY